MTVREHTKNLNDFKRYSKSIVDSKDKSKQILIDIGVNTRTGKLKKNYTCKSSKKKTTSSQE